MVRDSFGVRVWKEIEKHWELFKSMTSFAVDNKRRVKCWKDGGVVRNLYVRFFHPCLPYLIPKKLG